MILFLLSLLAGFLTVLAPCTISLLPVIVGGSLSGERSFKRAFVVTASLGISVIIFTLVLKASTAFVDIPQSFWQILSGVVIIVLGITTIFPALYDRLPFLNSVNRGSNKLLAVGYQKQSSVGDMIVGAALGPVFSSCSPTYFLILATVLPKSFALGMVYLLAYVIGLSGTLFFVAIAGQKVLETLGVASDPKGWFKRAMGVLFVLVGIAILFGYDKKLELLVASNVFDVTKIEQQLLPSSGPRVTPITAPVDSTPTDVITADSVDTAPVATTTTPGAPVRKPAPKKTLSSTLKAVRFAKAPEITNPSGYVNTGGKPITFGEFRGKKVVLVDFWTYSCINCQRTLPYLKAWYEKYHDQGLEIIGIHTPEFAFEHVLGNVEKAVAADGLQYATVLDNDYGTWNAFGNQFWPRKYLIDIDGYIVYDHAGEGNYEETEMAIQKALAERATVLGATNMPSTGVVAPKDVITVNSTAVQSRETYFGYSRNQNFGNGSPGIPGTQTLTLPESPKAGTLYLGGMWNFTSESAVAKEAHAKIRYRFQARDVYFVASSPSGIKVTLTIDGKPIGAAGGADVAADGTVLIKDNRLYKLVHMADYGDHVLDMDIEGPGLEAYTFTFG